MMPPTTTTVNTAFHGEGTLIAGAHTPPDIEPTQGNSGVKHIDVPNKLVAALAPGAADAQYVAPAGNGPTKPG